MNQETKDIVILGANQVPGWTGFALTGETVIMVLSIVLLLVQIGYYVHRWIKHSTAWGIKLKRWAERATRPADLGDE